MWRENYDLHPLNMTPAETPQHQPDDLKDQRIRCDGCESAFRTQGFHELSFLLLDQLRLPVIGCDDHVEQFTTVCGLTTGDTVELLQHRPAGGVTCPSCRLAPYNPSQPVIPVQHGAVGILACPEHQAEILTRYQKGLETQQQLTASLDTIEDL